ncbi:MAG: S8 family serine peptidase [Campylobacterota bacterium]|nr:S8 family serine peptidase [Campylobacterota bacterium]
MKRYSFMLAILFAFMFIGCGGGGGSDTTSNTDTGKVTYDLANATVIYSDTPSKDNEGTISLSTDTNDSLENLSWSIVSQPDTSNLVLAKSTDKKVVTFTPTVVGDYKIVATLTANGTKKETSFAISEVFEFSESKVEGVDENTTIDEVIGVIVNQSWVYSSSLSEAEIKTIVEQYTQLEIKGYDEIDGLLIEYNENDNSTKEAIEELKLEEGIDSVVNRVHEGDDTPRTEEITPDDGSAFNDGGDNWHLEKINITEAWEYTTGNQNILIGVSDSGFDIKHDELKNRFSEILTSSKSDHGNGVAGAIGANTNNKTGISGINWKSKLILGGSGKNNLKSIVKKNIITVNNSWAIPGYLSTSFDPESTISVTARNIKTLASSRSYRKLANGNLDKLFVWSAGNGIGNGKGNSNKVYGVDGRHHSPALHYDGKGNLNKQSNVIFVAAMKSDDKLVYYSNYGKSVDIAAPTSYKSLKIDDKYYTGDNYGDGLSGFVGTSAAAPVVTGVASLIYSIYPGFTGKEVKDILINSAADFVKKRYTDSTGNDENLAHQIPILNAKAALEKAQEIIDSKVTITDDMPNPFEAKAKIDFKSIDDDFEVVGVSWELQSSQDFGVTWNYLNGMSENSDSITPNLDTTTSYHKIVASVTLKNKTNNSETIANKEYLFNYTKVPVVAQDTTSLNSISDATVSITKSFALPITYTGLTSNSDMLYLYLKNGTYKAYATHDDYQKAVSEFTINGLQSLQVTINMTSNSAGEVGSLAGKILDIDGNAIENASIRISGGEQTNGFFASANSDGQGNYNLTNISKNDSSGNPIETFTLEISANGYSTTIRANVIVLKGKERTENFTLTKLDLTENTIFSDDFETITVDWTATGFWNQIDLSDNNIYNTLVENGYVSLAPDEGSTKAMLPLAKSGNSAWWYGKSDTGTFIGTQSSSDSLLSGGFSTNSNSGSLTSPSIDLTNATNPILKFQTWWEIESVNPNENGFDIMEIQISTDGGNTFSTIKKLNPYIDPNDNSRDSKPFSSAGFNRTPVWALEEIYLSDYIGNNVILKFNFKTNDEMFNGFRGWFVDDMQIVDLSISEIQSKSLKSLARNITKSTDKDSDEVISEFIRIHKKPIIYNNSLLQKRE